MSLLSELSKNQQYYYIVDIQQLYQNTFLKVQLILWYIGNSGIGCFANYIHDTSNPTHM